MLSSVFPMRLAGRLTAVMTFALSAAAMSAAEDFRLIRSLSGPSGKVDGSKFVFDEVRTRFVHPQDKSLIAYFEWEGSPGTHALTGLWRRPDGRVDSISPEVKIESKSNQLTCYWTYTLDPEMMPGVWTVEVRIDGQPAGSHSFEIAGTSPPKANLTGTVNQKLPTLDQIFQSVSPSLAWVRKIDGAGKVTDTASGFILAKDRVMTALQGVDGANKLEIEFAGGRKVVTDELAACLRSGDWAVVVVDTASLPALPVGDSKLVAVGERVIAFNVEGDAKAIGRVDISGKRMVQGFGDRIQFSPALAPEATGGPLLDVKGNVMGVLGGSVMPGTRFDPRHMSVNPALGITTKALTAATPTSGIPGEIPVKIWKLRDLVASGVLTPPLSDMDALIYVTTSREMSKSANDALPKETSEFSRRDKQVWVISEWQKKGKVSKGVVAARVYDAENHVRVTVEPKKTSLPYSPMRSGFSFSPGSLDPGVYRIDLTWDDQPVWRTFIRVTD